MIPKIIHYCWFGGNEKPEIVKQCIASWKKHCPDWEIKEWNESNFDVNVMPYTKEAYAAKKWAFVSDVARLMILCEQGGVYLDTDVEITSDRPFDDYLLFENVIVFETERSINTGLCFACSKESELADRFLDSYRMEHYAKDNEIINSKMNHAVLLAEYGELKWNGKTQIIKDTCVLGCEAYSKIMRHYGTRSWCDDLPEYQVSGFWGIKRFLRNPEIFRYMEAHRFLRNLVPVYEFVVYDVLDLGIGYYFKRMMLRIKSKLKR